MIIRHEYVWQWKTELVADINPDVADAVDPGPAWSHRDKYALGFNGALYFQADDGRHGAELWRTTSAGGVELVADIAWSSPGSEPYSFAIFKDQRYFAAATAATGEQLFRFDGKDVSVATNIDAEAGRRRRLQGLTVYKDALYFLHSN